MKKTTLLILMTLAMLMTAQADDYFIMGDNGKVNVSRSALGGQITLNVKAHFDDPVDRWNISASYPDGMVPVTAVAGPDMTITYMGSQGEDCIHEVPLSTTSDLSAYTGMTSVYGYFLFSGSYMQYGLVKWEPKEYGEMFTVTLLLSNDFAGGELVMQGTIASSYDHRYWSSGMSTMFYKTVTFAVEPLIGDVDNNGLVNITDATTLISLLLNNGTIDVDALPAADMNGDGLINITDATELIGKLLNE